MSGSPPPTSEGANQAKAPTPAPIAAARKTGRDARQAIANGQGAEQCAVIGDGQQAEDAARDKEQDSRFGRRGRQSGDVEIRRIAQEQPGERDGGRGGRERGDGHATLESLRQFLQHENRAGDRRVEGGGEARARARREQHPAVRRTKAAAPPDKMRDARAHLDARPFAAQREARTDGEQAAEKLDRQQHEGRGRRLAAQDRLDMGNAAARRMRRESPHHPGRGGRGRAAGKDGGDEAQSAPAVHAQALRAPTLRESQSRIAKPVRPLQRETEQRADQAGGASGHEREQRQRGKAARIFRIGLRRELRICAHRHPVVRLVPGPAKPVSQERRRRRKPFSGSANVRLAS